MLGGGIFVTQDKTLPGSYINFVNASSAGSHIGERGVVAIALPLGNHEVDTIHECTKGEFLKGDFVLTTNDCYKVLSDIFCHANKVIIYNTQDVDDTDTSAYDVEDVIKSLEPYEFNVLCAYTNDATEAKAYMDSVQAWRDELGKKCQVVVYNQNNPNHEGVINVVSTVSDDGADTHTLTAWVAGAMAGCKINESCTNMLYDGEYTINVNKTQAELEQCIKDGQVAFHRVYGEIRLLEDINSLTTTTADKGEDFKSNQTIRVIDQIANDIAKLFNTKYLGRIPNNESGRVSLWADIVKHHKELEAIQAIENFDSSLLTIAKGDTKKSVVVNDCVTVTNAMAQLYMTVVIQ